MERGVYSRQLGAAVAAQSAGLMTTELVMTRLFSVVIWYHFAFFAISVALFGAGFASVVVHVFRARVEGSRAFRLCASASAAFAVAVVVVDVFLARVVPVWFDAIASGQAPSPALKILGLFLVSSMPFFAGGFALSLAVTRSREHVPLVYSADLLGAASACVLVVPLLSVLGGPAALLSAAALGAFAAVAFALASGEDPRGVVAVPLGALAAGVAMLVLLGLDAPRAKQMDLREHPPEFDGWNSFSRVTVVPLEGFRGWGTSPSYHGPVPQQKALFIDMAALTVLTRFGGDVSAARYTLFDLSAAVYRAMPNPREVCVIGAGAGKDVLAALAAGASRVTAAEINPLIVNGVMRGKLRAFAGDLYSRPDVDVHVEDGRSFVRASSRRFDVILLSMVDTSAATAAGAFALTENSLYTSDAFADFFDRLSPSGVLSVSTVSLPGMAVGARLVSLARAAIERRGGSPSRSIAVLQTPWVHTEGTMHDLLVKPSGFTADEVSALGRAAGELGFVAAYLPGARAPSSLGENEWIFRIATAKDSGVLAREIEAAPLDVSAVSDDRPFFFYQDRIRYFLPALFAASAAYPFGDGLIVLSKVLGVTLSLVLLCLLVPLAFSWNELRRGKGAAVWDVGYVSCLGLGFMFVEIGMLDRLSLYLGNPTYTLSVVLATLLVASGLGSRFLAPGIERRGAPRFATMLLAAALSILVSGALAPKLLSSASGAPAVLRAALSALVLLPLGLLLGAPFPAGLAAVARRAPERIPWLWAVNSGTSVLGSVLATLLSLHGGIGVTLACGAASYVGAALLSLLAFRGSEAVHG